jgi:hypothetical protein
VPPRAAPDWPEGRALAPPSSVNVPAASTLLDHPRIVYLREADLLPPPGRLAHGLFDPANEVARFRVVLGLLGPTSG